METLFVSGLSRCGTTLMMRMLDVGGISTFCDSKASYESGHCTFGAKILDLMPMVGNAAVKILDPIHYQWPGHLEAQMIWLRRDPIEQAKSQIKFLKMIGVNIQKDRVRELADSIEPDTIEAQNFLSSIGLYLLTVHFEDILSDPASIALGISEFLKRPDLDLQRMAAVVIKRGPECLPDLRIENAAMIREARPKRRQTDRARRVR